MKTRLADPTPVDTLLAHEARARRNTVDNRSGGPVGPLSHDAKTRVTTIRGVVDGPLGAGRECLVVIYGGTLGRKHELHDDVVTIGRDPDNSISLEVDCVSRRHARIETQDGYKYAVDAQSTNGTYVNDVAVARERLKSGDFIKIGDTIFKFLSGANIETAYHEEIYTMTVTDGLTQVPNRRYLLEYLEREFSRARRYGRNLSCLMIDIDHFKHINDTYGHLTGDYVLKELATTLKKRIRREEVFARFGGEEFCIILPESDPESVREFAATVRRLVEVHPFEFEGSKLSITVSIGVGHLDASMKEPQDLLRTADERLYEAKRHGRNRVTG